MPSCDFGPWGASSTWRVCYTSQKYLTISVSNDKTLFIKHGQWVTRWNRFSKKPPEFAKIQESSRNWVSYHHNSKETTTQFVDTRWLESVDSWRERIQRIDNGVTQLYREGWRSRAVTSRLTCRWHATLQSRGDDRHDTWRMTGGVERRGGIKRFPFRLSFQESPIFK